MSKTKTKITKRPKHENKEVEILFHTISYWYDNDMDMPECEEEHVKECINDGFSSGNLCYYDSETETEVYGWWSIEN